MKGTLRHPLIFLVVFLVCLPALSLASDVIPTNRWCDYFSYGSTLNGQPLPVGTVIDAYDPDEVHCGTFTVHTEGLYGYLHVYGDDPLTEIDEGAAEGDTITFYINGTLATTSGDSAWVGGPPGGTFEVNLSAGVAADFSGSPTSGHAPLAVQFTDQSAGEIESWSWAFGDGDSSSVQHPSHTYAAVGTYTVSLRVTGPGGTDTETKADYIITGILGDVSGNGEVMAFDAGLILQEEVGIIELPDPVWPNFTVEIADVTDDGEISSYDGAWVLQRVVGLRDEDYRWVGKVVAFSSEARKVVLSSEAMGDRVKVRVAFDDLSGVLAGQMTLGYDGSLFRVVEVTPSAQLSERGFLFQSHVKGEEVRLAFAGSVALEGGGDLAQVALEVLGEGTPEVLGHPLVTREVALNEGAIVVAAEVEAASAEPEVHSLSQNSPNPFNAETEIGYALPEGGKVRLKVYSVSGQLVRVLVDGEQGVGWHSAHWDGKDGEGRGVASGVYLYRIQVNGFVEVRKMALIR